jgi:hypothetical protein
MTTRGDYSKTGDSGPFRTADNVVSDLAFAFEQHIGLADSIGLGIDLLAVEVAIYPDSALFRDLC